MGSEYNRDLLKERLATRREVKKAIPLNRDLTNRQKEILKAIVVLIKDHGMMPTFREIGNAVGIKSVNGVNDHLISLERKGWIERSDEPLSRGIKLTFKAQVEHECFDAKRANDIIGNINNYLTQLQGSGLDLEKEVVRDIRLIINRG